MTKRERSMTVIFARRKILRTMRQLSKQIRTEAEEQEDLFTRQDLLELADLVDRESERMMENE